MTAPASPTAWNALAAHRDALAGTRIESLFEADPARAASLTLPFAGLVADFSKQRITPETVSACSPPSPGSAGFPRPSSAFSPVPP